MTDVTMKTLAKNPVLSQLGASVCQLLIAETSLLSFKSGDVIYEYGELLNGIYALVSGYVKLYRESKDKIQILALLRELVQKRYRILNRVHNLAFRDVTARLATVILIRARVYFRKPQG